MSKLKIIPYTKESEMMVLGCMLTSVISLNIASDGLEDEDFYFTEHKIIFQILKSFFKKNKPADLHLVAEELKRLDKIETIGGIVYLTTLAQYAGTSAFIEEYIEIIKDKSTKRQMVNAAQIIEKKSIEDLNDSIELLDEAQKLFFEISQSNSLKSGILIDEIIDGIKTESKIPFLQELKEKQERFAQNGHEDLVCGIPTHFIDLDRMINGMMNSNLVILAARPAMGKTAFAINIAENICFKNKMSVGIFSLEMSSEQLFHRIVCSQAEVESDKMKKGSLSTVEYQRVENCVIEMKKQTMIIDDQAGLKVTDLRARARRMKERYGIGILIIDYLQLLSGSSMRTNENRQNEISEISRMLKNLARELNIPIICLSQLSRKVEERPNHRPMMSDLRESGSIEQDADIVMFLLRQEYYNPDDKPGMAELIVAKNRHGSVGSVNLFFQKSFAKFGNYIKLDLSKELEDNSIFNHFSPKYH